MKIKLHNSYIVLLLLFGLIACNKNKNNIDASGTFEAEETIISAEATGTLKEFNITEGATIKQGDVIGYIDSTQLYLKKKQLEAQIKSMLNKKPNIAIQLSALNQQLTSTLKEKIRIENLVKADAATTKQLDDINAQIELIKKQIEAQRSNLSITTEGINNDALSLFIQIDQLQDQINKCKITNPISGTVLTKYAYANELALAGKPLYKIANLSTLVLRAYITGNQLPNIKLNQEVTVLTDDGNGGFNETKGILFWINDKAEFTPKTIQTKNERANMVYAIKVNISNNGQYKIGMYGEIKFN